VKLRYSSEGTARYATDVQNHQMSDCFLACVTKCWLRRCECFCVCVFTAPHSQWTCLCTICYKYLRNASVVSCTITIAHQLTRSHAANKH